MLKIKKLWPAAVLIAAFLVSVALGQFKSEPPKLATPDISLPVKTIIATERDKQFWIYSQGTVTPRTSIVLVAEVSGAILQVARNYVVGGVFKKGEVILELDSTEYEVRVSRAKANLARSMTKMTLEEARAIQAAEEWDRTGQPRTKAPALSLRTPYLHEAKAEVEQAKSELLQADKLLEKTLVRAPYDAMISSKSVDLGSFVTVGSQLGELFAIDRAEVRLSITDRDLALLAEDPMVSDASFDTNLGVPSAAKEITLSSQFKGRKQYWSANIIRSEGVIDPKNRSRYWVAQIDDPYGLYKSSSNPQLTVGSFVSAKIPAAKHSGIFAIPRNALYNNNQLAIVDHVEGDEQSKRLSFQSVHIYSYDDEHAYIDSGLTNGTEIIITPIGIPIEGMLVAPDSLKADIKQSDNEAVNP